MSILAGRDRVSAGRDQVLAGRDMVSAGRDRVCVEPPIEDNPLFHAKNCYVTPHIAGATAAARGRLLQTTVDNVASFISGVPQNVVN